MTLDLNDVRFGSGSHPETPLPTGNRDLCIMEAVAFMSGEPWSAKPVCASPTIARFLRSWQDSLSDDDRDRLLPASIWVPRLIGSRGDDEIERIRLGLIHSWLLRVCVPAWLDLVPEFAAHAVALRALPETPPKTDSFVFATGDSWYSVAITTTESVYREMRSNTEWAGTSLQRKHAAFQTAWNHVTASAGGVLRGDTRIDAITASTEAAKLAVARGIDLRPTVEQLQQSALDLLDRMLNCKV